jgi:hypothetical protein
MRVAFHLGVGFVIAVAFMACGDDGGVTDSGMGLDSGTRRDGGDSGAMTDTGSGGDGSGGECMAATCGECTPMGPCGWCESTRTCLVGGAMGPDMGSCADWDYVPSDCADFDAGPPPDCTDGTSCDTCTPMAGCGWCTNGTMGMCTNGTEMGPTMGTCATWDWLPSECESAGMDAGTPP